MDKQSIAKYLDHTLLKADATYEQLQAVCEEAKKYNVAAVCVNSVNVDFVHKELKGSGIKTCSVVGFPLGAMASAAKEPTPPMPNTATRACFNRSKAVFPSSNSALEKICSSSISDPSLYPLVSRNFLCCFCHGKRLYSLAIQRTTLSASLLRNRS